LIPPLRGAEYWAEFEPGLLWMDVFIFYYLPVEKFGAPAAAKIRHRHTSSFGLNFENDTD